MFQAQINRREPSKHSVIVLFKAGCVIGFYLEELYRVKGLERNTNIMFCQHKTLAADKY